MKPWSSRLLAILAARPVGRGQRWGALLVRTVRGAFRDDFGIAASSIAFAAFLALVPLIGLVAGAYALLVPRGDVARHIATLIAILPLDAQRIVVRNVGRALDPGHADAATLSASLIIALLSARRAGRSLLHGINRASYVDRERTGWRRQLASTLLVLACAAMVVTALVSLSVLTFLQGYVPDGLPGARLLSIVTLFGTLTVGAGAGVMLIYRYAPAGAPVPWRSAVPGTALAVALWFAATLILRGYVARFARFDDTYGSLSAVVVLMLWLVISAWALLLGARLNAEASRRFARGTSKNLEGRR